MIKKAFVLFCLLGYSLFSHADICPSVSAIKQSKLNGWQIYDSDDDKLLTYERAQYFRNNVYAFVLAEWTKNRTHGAIHCYYRNQSGATIEAYVAKKNLAPVKQSKNFWYQVSGAMHCAAKVNECSFESIFPTKQLAKN